MTASSLTTVSWLLNVRHTRYHRTYWIRAVGKSFITHGALRPVTLNPLIGIRACALVRERAKTDLRWSPINPQRRDDILISEKILDRSVTDLPVKSFQRVRSLPFFHVCVRIYLQSAFAFWTHVLHALHHYFCTRGRRIIRLLKLFVTGSCKERM